MRCTLTQSRYAIASICHTGCTRVWRLLDLAQVKFPGPRTARRPTHSSRARRQEQPPKEVVECHIRTEPLRASTAAQISRFRRKTRSTTPAVDSRTNRSAALRVARRARQSEVMAEAEAEAEDMVRRGRCSPLSAPSAARIQQFHSSRGETVRSTAANASAGVSRRGAATKRPVTITHYFPIRFAHRLEARANSRRPHLDDRCPEGMNT